MTPVLEDAHLSHLMATASTVRTSRRPAPTRLAPRRPRRPPSRRAGRPRRSRWMVRAVVPRDVSYHKGSLLMSANVTSDPTPLRPAWCCPDVGLYSRLQKDLTVDVASQQHFQLRQQSIRPNATQILSAHPADARCTVHANPSPSVMGSMTIQRGLPY